MDKAAITPELVSRLVGLPVDDATWVRGRGWVLWKCAIVLVDALENDPEDAKHTKHVIEEVLAEEP